MSTCACVFVKAVARANTEEKMNCAHRHLASNQPTKSALPTIDAPSSDHCLKHTFSQAKISYMPINEQNRVKKFDELSKIWVAVANGCVHENRVFRVQFASASLCWRAFL